MTRSLKLVLCIGVVAIILACLFRFGLLGGKGGASVITSSKLSNTIRINQLSAAEFKYRGIADVYKNDKKNSLLCRICYSATVKAGIDMDEVRFTVDADAKKVTAALPDIDIRVTVVDDESFAVLPSDVEVGIDRMLKYSREDVEAEARASEDLMAAARENLEATIEALLYPILTPQGYSLVWE